MANSNKFTGVLAEIETIIGTTDTLKLASQYGGTDIVIPKKPTANCLLAQLIGLENVKKLVTDFGSCKISVPMGYWRGFGRKKIEIAQMLEAGISEAKIALSMDVHSRTVMRVKQKDYSRLPLLEYIEQLKEKENKNEEKM